MGLAVLICALNCSFPHWVLFSLRETEAAVLSIIDGFTDSDVSHSEADCISIFAVLCCQRFRFNVTKHILLCICL